MGSILVQDGEMLDVQRQEMARTETQRPDGGEEG